MNRESETTTCDVLVIGAGAAGIFAAWRAATEGARTILIEKTPRIGTKILVSGGGKCNIVHDGPIEDVLRAFRPNEARFLRPSVYRHPNETIVRMFTDRGLKTMTREDGRIFPVDATAKDVVNVLRSYLDEAGVDLRLESPCTGLAIEDGRVVGATVGAYESTGAAPKLSGGYGAKALLRETGGIVHEGDRASGTILAGATILATGGSSYPNSGTTGDGWKWAA
ncbi:FAD-binding protein, partial [bacterium]